MNDVATEAEPQHLAPAAVPVPPVTLELSLDPVSARRLWRTAPIAALGGGRLRTSRTRITWHDHADGGLAAAGCALLQHEPGGAGAWQIQQAARDGVLLWPIATPAPVLAEAPSAALLPGLTEAAVAPVATLDGHRRALRPDGAVAEVALLDGEIAVGAARLPVARLSLHGEAAPVFELARALLPLLPAGVAAHSVSGEMQGVLRGTPAPTPPRLHPALDVDEAFAHVVSQLTLAILFHAPGARSGATTEPVHQMRVALRRLRSALSLFRRLADGPELERARRDLGALARALGPARDWDVFLAGTGREVGRLLPDERALARLNGAARRRRAAAYAELERLLLSPAFQATMLDLTQLAVARPWRRDPSADRPMLAAFARHALDRKLKRVLQAGEDLSPLPAEALHALRIRCKRLRYAAEFFAPLAPGKPSRRFLRRLSAVQERLGQLNDGTVAAELLGQLGQRGFAAGLVQGYLAARTGGGRAKAERSWRKFRRADPFWE